MHAMSDPRSPAARDRPESPPPVIEIRRLVKVFPAVRALDDVSLAIREGEVHGVIGENGAGKSTLMKILSGVYQPTSGEILLRGEPVAIGSVHDAGARGIAMIHQELNLVDELSVADNIFLGRESTRFGFIEKRKQHDAARELLKRINSPLDPGRKVKTLSIAEQQLVEIAKALSTDARILIMDEPTAVLTERETKSLFDLIASLKREGVTVLYISHILPEVIHLCDRITVLRDGELVTTIPGEGASEAQLAGLMVGRPLSDFFPDRPAISEKTVIEVKGLTVPGVAEDCSFSVRAGEIFGFAGLIGAGRTELAEAIFGLRKRSRGSVLLRGEELDIRSPRDAVRRGIAYLSEDRKGRGLILNMGVTENTTLVSLRRYCKPFIARREEDVATQQHVDRLRIKCGPLRVPIRTLSGGNQQKVAISKWLETSPEVFILDEPTRGIDIAAKREIYDLITKLAEDGRACIFISSELPELLGLCHRIAVMRAGRIEAILDGPATTEEEIMHYAAGVKSAEKAA